MATLAAIAFTVAGCAFLYLASPNQKWLAQPLPGRRVLPAGSLSLLAGLALSIAAWRPLCGVFMTLHIAIACLVAFPYIAALRGLRRSR